MTSAAFIDANVPIYAAGGDHPYKEPCARIISMVAANHRSFVTSVEVLQELLHRYLAVRRWALGREVVREFAAVMAGRMEPVFAEDVEVAATLADRHPRMSSRDFIHAAVMQRLGVEWIVSADKGFDGLPGITRLDPTNVEEWRDSVLAAEGA